jgi:hypothetical protein
MMKGRTMGRFLIGLKHLVCQLMGDLMQQDLAYRIPGVMKNKLMADANLSSAAAPAAPTVLHSADPEQRFSHPLRKPRFQHPQGFFPFTGQPLQHALFQRSLNADGVGNFRWAHQSWLLSINRESVNGQAKARDMNSNAESEKHTIWTCAPIA